MDLYNLWFDAGDGVRDAEILRGVDAWMGHLSEAGAIEGWRLMRSKLGLSGSLGEWHLMIEVRDLAQLDEAFGIAAARSGEAETLHHGIIAKVRNFRAALYRDFPDPVRNWGEEKF